MCSYVDVLSPWSQDSSGSVKLWEITRGIVVENYGEVGYAS